MNSNCIELKYICLRCYKTFERGYESNWVCSRCIHRGNYEKSIKELRLVNINDMPDLISQGGVFFYRAEGRHGH